jgi:VanZ family protein
MMPARENQRRAPLLLPLAGLIAWLSAFVMLLGCPRHVADGPPLVLCDFEQAAPVAADGFPTPPAPWQWSPGNAVWESRGGFGDSGGVRLVASEAQPAFLEMHLPDPRRYAALAFRGRMRVEACAAGDNPWNAARLLVYFRDPDGAALWNHPHTICRFVGTAPWKEYRRVIRVPDGAVSAHVVVQNSCRSGTVWCDDIALQPVRINPLFVSATALVIGAGLALVSWAVWLWGLWKGRGWVTLVLGGAIIFGAVCANAYLDMLAGLLQVDVRLLKKTGHFLLFGALGCAVCLGQTARAHRRKGAVTAAARAWTVVGLLVFAAATEFLQFATLDRSPAFTDLLIDAAGILAGTTLALMVSAGRR